PHSSRVTIPRGFKDMLEGFCKAVVKYQPENIPAFAMSFFSVLVIFRDENPSMPIEELMKEFRATKGSQCKQASLLI
uniref:RIIa domain-containing protein n=1 Tax=Esox lucius TaxID=8010 RepID=A0A6Q2XC26_ESOLU